MLIVVLDHFAHTYINKYTGKHHSPQYWQLPICSLQSLYPLLSSKGGRLIGLSIEITVNAIFTLEARDEAKAATGRK